MTAAIASDTSRMMIGYFMSHAIRNLWTPFEVVAMQPSPRHIAKRYAYCSAGSCDGGAVGGRTRRSFHHAMPIPVVGIGRACAPSPNRERSCAKPRPPRDLTVVQPLSCEALDKPNFLQATHGEVRRVGLEPT